jgi:hypothetical protein
MVAFVSEFLRFLHVQKIRAHSDSDDPDIRRRTHRIGSGIGVGTVHLYAVLDSPRLALRGMQFVPEHYVYKMKPSARPLRNIEFYVVIASDANGFRVHHGSHYEVAAIGDSRVGGSMTITPSRPC